MRGVDTTCRNETARKQNKKSILQIDTIFFISSHHSIRKLAWSQPVDPSVV